MISSVIFSSFDYRVMEQLNILDSKMAKALFMKPHSQLSYCHQN